MKEELEAQIKAFSVEQDSILNSDTLKKINDEIRRAKYQLEKYEDELAKFNTSNMNYVEAISMERELRDTVELAKQRLKEKEEEKANLEEEMDEDDKKKRMSELRDKKSAYFTQTKMKIEDRIRRAKYEMEGILLDVKDFKYEYEPGTRTITRDRKSVV